MRCYKQQMRRNSASAAHFEGKICCGGVNFRAAAAANCRKMGREESRPVMADHNLLRRFDDLSAAQIQAQYLRDLDCAVSTLVILHGRDHHPCERQTAAVQGMDELRLLPAFRTIADVGAAGLKGF